MTKVGKYPWNWTSIRGPYKFCRVHADLANGPAAMGLVRASWPLAVRGYMANPSAPASHTVNPATSVVIPR
jgi:hypothetical protein